MSTEEASNAYTVVPMDRSAQTPVGHALNGFEAEAEKLLMESIKRSNVPYTDIKTLVDGRFLDLGRYVDTLTNDYEIKMSSHPGSINALRVSQREVGYINSSQIARNITIGTNNIQQCVVLLFDGFDNTALPQRQIALAHIDRFTTQESIDKIFTNFNSSLELKVSLYGGRDMSLGQKHVSESNIQSAKIALTNARNTHNIVLVYENIANPSAQQDIIYNPNARSITEGIYPNKDYETSIITQQQRIAEDSYKKHDYSTSSRDIVRDCDLMEKNMLHTESQDIRLSDATAQRILINYSQNGLDWQISQLSKIIDSERRQEVGFCSRSDFCARTFSTSVKSIKTAFKIMGCSDVDIDQIYSCEPGIKSKASIAVHRYISSLRSSPTLRGAELLRPCEQQMETQFESIPSTLGDYAIQTHNLPSSVRASPTLTMPDDVSSEASDIRDRMNRFRSSSVHSDLGNSVSASQKRSRSPKTNDGLRAKRAQSLPPSF